VLLGSGRRGLVGEDDRARGPNAGGGERLVSRQHPGEDVALARSGHEERDERLRVQIRERERQPRVGRRQARLRDVEYGAGSRELLLVPGVERGRVTVRSDAEQDEVEGLRERDVGRPQRMNLLVRNGDAR
jgi:hypothetical protein